MFIQTLESALSLSSVLTPPCSSFCEGAVFPLPPPQRAHGAGRSVLALELRHVLTRGHIYLCGVQGAAYVMVDKLDHGSPSWDSQAKEAGNEPANKLSCRRLSDKGLGG